MTKAVAIPTPPSFRCLLVIAITAVACGPSEPPPPGRRACSRPCACADAEATSCLPACDAAAQFAGTWSTTSAELEARVIELVNVQRAAGGCCGDRGCFGAAPPLSTNLLLATAARMHAADMAAHAYFSHDGTDGRAPVDRAHDAGFDGCALAENIARGQTSADAVVSAWMVSPGHCENILWSAVDSVGIGHASSADDFQAYWVQDFGGE